MHVVVPYAAESPKTRLEDVLDADEREAFAEAMLADVLAAVTGAEVDPGEYADADFRKLILILGILTVHSFPEGVAIGVSFAELNFAGGVQFLGFVVPLLGIFMTVAISIHNIPEGIAISIPLRSMGVSEFRMAWWAVFSSLPQPIGAVLAFYFVRIAREFLPFGYGFAAGAMLFVISDEIVPETHLRGHERIATLGTMAGVVVMLYLDVTLG